LLNFTAPAVEKTACLPSSFAAEERFQPSFQLEHRRVESVGVAVNPVEAGCPLDASLLHLGSGLPDLGSQFFDLLTPLALDGLEFRGPGLLPFGQHVGVRQQLVEIVPLNERP
jgi:hypothetical protein